MRWPLHEPDELSEIVAKSEDIRVKILAIIDVAPGARMEAVRDRLADELKGSWALFASGVLREAYATAAATRVIFILEAEDVPSAEDHLRKLPLVAAGSFRFELMELRPFVNWSTLFAR
jgi:hypothetical protein